jgi:aspartate kinase
MTQIFKFGGASVRSSEAIRDVLKIIQKNREGRLLIVVSAMGKTTSRLEELGKCVLCRGNYQNILDEIRQYHQGIIEELELHGNILQNIIGELNNVIDNVDGSESTFMDQLYAFGELISTTIIHEFLRSRLSIQWIDARQYIRTNSDFNEARVHWEETSALIQNVKPVLENEIVLTQGFIGSDHYGNTTTLGKEGSDFTAAIFAHCLDADSMTVWKDVPGIMNADPKLMSDVSMYTDLSYQEITEMTYYGAKVIHPKTMKPLAVKGIPLFVRSFKEPHENGTRIDADPNLKVTLPTFIFKFDQLVVTFRSRDDSFMDETKLIQMLSVMDRLRISVNLMQNSALTFTVCFDFDANKLERLREELNATYQLTFNEGLHLATIKNYDDRAIKKLPNHSEMILEQKSRSVFQRLYAP